MSQLNSTVPTGDRNYSNELKKKERRIKELEERLKKRNDEKQLNPARGRAVSNNAGAAAAGD